MVVLVCAKAALVAANDSNIPGPTPSSMAGAPGSTTKRSRPCARRRFAEDKGEGHTGPEGIETLR